MAYSPGDDLTASAVNRYMAAARDVEQRDLRYRQGNLATNTRFNLVCKRQGSTDIRPFSIVYAKSNTVARDKYYLVEKRGDNRDLHRHVMLVMDDKGIMGQTDAFGRAGYVSQPILIGMDQSALDGNDNVKYMDNPHGVNTTTGWLEPYTGGFRILDYKAKTIGTTKVVLAFQQEIPQNYQAGNNPNLVVDNQPHPLLGQGSGTNNWGYGPGIVNGTSFYGFHTGGLYNVQGVVRFQKAFTDEQKHTVEFTLKIWIYAGGAPDHATDIAIKVRVQDMQTTYYYAGPPAIQPHYENGAKVRSVNFNVYVKQNEFIGYQISAVVLPSGTPHTENLYCNAYLHSRLISHTTNLGG